MAVFKCPVLWSVPGAGVVGVGRVTGEDAAWLGVAGFWAGMAES